MNPVRNYITLMYAAERKISNGMNTDSIED